MPLFKLVLTAGAISSILLQTRSGGRPKELVRFPDGLLRAGVGLSVAAMVLYWLFPSFWMGILALLAELPVLMWRNCRISCAKRTFTISGISGLKWTYSYAEAESLRGPFLHAGGHIFLLYPGTENRAAFIEQLRQSMAVAARDAKYRKSAPQSHPKNAENKQRIGFYALWVVLFALMIFSGLRPITADTGRIYEVTLRSAALRWNDIRLDFGYGDYFEIAHTELTAPLLDESMSGSDFTVQATHHSGRNTRDRYEVIALTGADGTVYLTWEESEIIRQENIPVQLLTYLSFLLLPFLLGIDPGKARRTR